MSIEKIEWDIEAMNTRIQEKLIDNESPELLTWFNKVKPLQKEDTDSTLILANKIKALGEDKFINLMKENLDAVEARKLLGWWEKYKEFDSGNKVSNPPKYMILIIDPQKGIGLHQ